MRALLRDALAALLLFSLLFGPFLIPAFFGGSPK